MSSSIDQSSLDRKNFIDKEKYNCPFCNRKSITYSVNNRFSFNWSQEKVVFGYLVTCGGDACRQTSLHLSDHDIEVHNNEFWSLKIKESRLSTSKFELDKLFFYHQPTTFFTIDNHVHEKIRTKISLVSVGM